MQGIERSIAKAGGVTPRQFPADVEYRVRETDLSPHSCRPIPLELQIDLLGLATRQLFLKNVPFNGVDLLRAVQGGQQKIRPQGHAPLCLARVAVRQIEGDDKTRIGVDAQ